MTDRSPKLAELLSAVLEHRLSSLHVCMPGIVQSYDSTNQTASVQPAIKNVIVCGDGEQQIAYPLIPNVPVSFPRAGRWFIHFPLNPGDAVTLIFGERSLDQWRALGGFGVDPLDLRKHDLSDAIAIPGSVYPDGSALTVPADHFVMGDQLGSTIHINADGTIAIGSVLPLDSVATANKVAADAALLSAFFTAVAAVPVATDPATTLAAVNVVLAAAKVVTLAGYPHGYGSAKVKVDP